MGTKKPTIPVTDSVVDETLKAHIAKWEEYIEKYNELTSDHGSVKQHWLDWANGESSPQEEFRGEKHPYPGWKKEHFKRLYEGARKWYEEYIAKEEKKRKEKIQVRMRMQWRWAFEKR